MNPPRIRAVASFGDDPEKVELSLPPGAVPEMLAEVAMKPQFQLYGMSVRYSYPDETLASRQSGPANTLVEVSLPYCLNLPNGIVLNVKTSACLPAFAALAKTWTELAEGSSAADFYAIDRVTYHSPGSIQTPSFPEEPELGPAARSPLATNRRPARCSGWPKFVMCPNTSIWSCSTYPTSKPTSCWDSIPTKGPVSTEGFGRAKYYREIRDRLDTDPQFLPYFEQESSVLPQFYRNIVRQDLGPLMEWLPEGALYHDPNAYLKSEHSKHVVALI
jgi:hypothetical protein